MIPQTNQYTTTFNFAKDEHTPTLALGHTDSAQFFVEEIKTPQTAIVFKPKVGERIDFTGDKTGRHYFSFRQKEDVRALIGMFNLLKVYIEGNNKHDIEISFYTNDINKMVVVFIAKNQLILAYPEKAGQNITIGRNNFEINNIDFRNYVFNFTTPKSIEACISILERIEIIIIETNNSLAMAC